MDSDPALPATGERLARSLRTGQLSVAGTQTGDLDVALVGAGESYAAWLVRASEQRFLWRFPRREPQDMPHPMAQEFAALCQVPTEVGSQGIAMDDTTNNVLGRRYLVTTYVPGRVLGADQWTDEHLAAHARQMAALHRRVHAGPGPVGERNDGRIDLLGQFDAGYQWWRGRHPQIADTPAMRELAAAVRAYLAQRAGVFDRDDLYSLIHGDLVATNIVIDDLGTPRFIDWEWAQVGDVARDLAYIGGEVYGGPWYVPMSRDQVESLVTAYLRHLPPAEQGQDRADLLARRDAWEVYERFLSSLHFTRQAAALGPDSIYQAAVRTLHRTLGVRVYEQ